MEKITEDRNITTLQCYASPYLSLFAGLFRKSTPFGEQNLQYLYLSRKLIWDIFCCSRYFTHSFPGQILIFPMKSNRKNDIKKVFLYVLLMVLLVILGVCAVNIANILLEYNSEKQKSDNEVTAFIEQVKEKQSEEGNATSEEDENPDNSTEYDLTGNTMGVITIPKIDVEAPVTVGIDELTLKSYAGIYPEYDPIGTEGGNTVMAAHSAIYGYCAHCFFHRLSELVPGDEIDVFWKNGVTYKYRVYEIFMNEDPNRTDVYDRVEGKEVLTLVTCTNGNSEVRTFLHAERTW